MYLRIYAVLIAAVILFAGCKDNSPIVINPTESEFSSHLGKGVWLTVPSLFEKVSSYDGCQMIGHSAPISVKIVNRKLEEFKSAFEPDVLSQTDQKRMPLKLSVFKILKVN